MDIVLGLLALQAALGAFDTLYFHEWRARLVARIPTTADELRLHAVRDFVYAALFGTLPFVAWHGAFVLLLGALLLIEIVVTMMDFIVEERVRKPMGGVFAGERVTHALMGIFYGAMLGYFVPVLAGWWREPTGWAVDPAPIPTAFAALLALMAAGTFVSGVRDSYALVDMKHGAWPWQRVPQ
jgi:hypothetical protein